MKRAKKREDKEKKEKAKRYTIANSNPNIIDTNPNTSREALLDAIEVHVLSTDPSSSEGDEAEQLRNKLSNLKVIATVEEETLKYKSRSQVVTLTNIHHPRQEKAKAKKSKSCHPRYDYLHGKYLNYYYNVVTGGYYKHSPKIRGLVKNSLINSNLHRLNKRVLLQPANTSLRSREVVAQGTSYVTAYTCRGWYVNNSNPNPTPNNIQYYRNSRGLLQQLQLTPGRGTPASEVPRTGVGTSINSPRQRTCRERWTRAQLLMPRYSPQTHRIVSRV